MFLFHRLGLCNLLRLMDGFSSIKPLGLRDLDALCCSVLTAYWPWFSHWRCQTNVIWCHLNHWMHKCTTWDSSSKKLLWILFPAALIFSFYVEAVARGLCTTSQLGVRQVSTHIHLGESQIYEHTHQKNVHALPQGDKYRMWLNGWAVKKTARYLPLYWLGRRDDCNGLLVSPYHWVVKTLIQSKQPCFFRIIAHFKWTASYSKPVIRLGKKTLAQG